MQGEASTYEGGLGTGPVEVTQTNVPYSTRVLVRYPKDASKFSGRVVVEPFNTSNGGKDLDAVWSMLAPLLLQRGDAWVGVTERTSAGEALKQADTTRYADINVPSNDVAWDVLAQVGAAVKQGGAQSPLAGLDAEHVYMAGYSQSGVDTAGFAIGLAKHYGTAVGKPVFDGYFPAAQAASATPLKAGTSVLPKFEYPVWPAVGVPVVNLEDQSGIMGFTAELPAEAQVTLGQKEYVNVSSATTRRADSDKKGDQYRLYEVAGMPHAPGGNGGCEGPASTFPIPVGGPGHVRAPQPLGRDRPEAAARAPREAGRARARTPRCRSTRTATRSAVSGRPTSTTRLSATTCRRPVRSPAGSRAMRLRSTAWRWRRSTRASTPT